MFANTRSLKVAKSRSLESSLICVIIAEGSSNALPVSSSILKTNLRQPQLNQEIKIKRAGVKIRVARLCEIQTCIDKGIAVISRIRNEAKSGLKDKRKVSAKDIYNYASDSMKLLMTAHKDMSQLRRGNVRAALPHHQRNICDSRL